MFDIDSIGVFRPNITDKRRYARNLYSDDNDDARVGSGASGLHDPIDDEIRIQHHVLAELDGLKDQLTGFLIDRDMHGDGLNDALYDAIAEYTQYLLGSVDAFDSFDCTEHTDKNTKVNVKLEMGDGENKKLSVTKTVDDQIDFNYSIVYNNGEDGEKMVSIIFADDYETGTEKKEFTI